MSAKQKDNKNCVPISEGDIVFVLSVRHKCLYA